MGTLFTDSEVAVRWKCCTRTVHRLRAAGKLESIKIGKVRRYTERGVIAVEAAGLV